MANTEVINDKGVIPHELQAQRNEHQWPFKQAKLKKKDKGAADRYALVPERPKTDDEKKKLIEFGGLSQVAESFYRVLRGMSTRWTLNSTKEGQFNTDEFQKCVEMFSARGETIKALSAEKDELENEIVALSKDTKLSAPEKGERFMEIAKRISEIKDAIDFKKQSTTEDEDEDVAVEAEAA